MYLICLLPTKMKRNNMIRYFFLSMFIDIFWAPNDLEIPVLNK